MQNKIFYSICFGFIIGVLVRSFVFVDLYLVILFSFLAFFSILFFNFISKNRWGIVSAMFVFVFMLGILRFSIADTIYPKYFEDNMGKKVDISGIIVDEPEEKEKNKKLLVEVEIEDKKIKILLTTGLERDFSYGDEIKIFGKLEKPENFITDQGKNFDYINYLRKDNILYLMSFPNIEKISEGNGSKLKSILFGIKNKFLEKLNMVIPNPESLLMGGLILGEKSSFDKALRQSFVDTGTIHIVALSGYNVTIVAEWIMKLFSFLPQNFAIYLGIFSIFLFVLMTGANSTAVRAGIMATLALVARATGRDYDVVRILILTGVVMIFLNPFILAYDVSFQLSFIATVAVILISPRIEKYFYWITKRFGLRDIISVTVSAYIFVLPFILYKMGNLSIVALPANILILPFIPLTMMFGFLTGIAGVFSYFISVPLGYVSFLLLHYELSMINFFSHLSFASFTVANFPLFITIGIYIFFIYKLFWKNIKKFFEN